MKRRRETLANSVARPVLVAALLAAPVGTAFAFDPAAPTAATARADTGGLLLNVRRFLGFTRRGPMEIIPRHVTAEHGTTALPLLAFVEPELARSVHAVSLVLPRNAATPPAPAPVPPARPRPRPPLGTDQPPAAQRTASSAPLQHAAEIGAPIAIPTARPDRGHDTPAAAAQPDRPNNPIAVAALARPTTSHARVPVPAPSPAAAARSKPDAPTAKPAEPANPLAAQEIAPGSTEDPSAQPPVPAPIAEAPHDDAAVEALDRSALEPGREPAPAPEADPATGAQPAMLLAAHNGAMAGAANQTDPIAEPAPLATDTAAQISTAEPGSAPTDAAAAGSGPPIPVSAPVVAMRMTDGDTASPHPSPSRKPMAESAPGATAEPAVQTSTPMVPSTGPHPPEFVRTQLAVLSIDTDPEEPISAWNAVGGALVGPFIGVARAAVPLAPESAEAAPSLLRSILPYGGITAPDDAQVADFVGPRRPPVLVAAADLTWKPRAPTTVTPKSKPRPTQPSAVNAKPSAEAVAPAVVPDNKGADPTTHGAHVGAVEVAAAPQLAAAAPAHTAPPTQNPTEAPDQSTPADEANQNSKAVPHGPDGADRHGASVGPATSGPSPDDRTSAEPLASTDDHTTAESHDMADADGNSAPAAPDPQAAPEADAEPGAHVKPEIPTQADTHAAPEAHAEADAHGADEGHGKPEEDAAAEEHGDAGEHAEDGEEGEIPAIQPKEVDFAEPPRLRPMPRLMRVMSALQDDIAQGSSAALAAQRIIGQRVSEALILIEDDDFRDPFIARSLVAYALTGGTPSDVRKAYDRGVFAPPYDKLIAGALAFMEGRESDAERHFSEVDPAAVPATLVGPLELALAALAVDDNPDLALKHLDQARLAAPATLVEEAALRRMILIAAEKDNHARFAESTDRYMRKFRGSIYAGNFRKRFTSALTRMTFLEKPGAFDQLQRILEPMTESGRREVFLELARTAVENGKSTAGTAAARIAMQGADEGSLEMTRGRLYAAAADVVNYEKTQDALDSLEAIPLTNLEDADIALRRAAISLGRSVIDIPPTTLAPAPDASSIAADALGEFEVATTVPANTAVGPAMPAPDSIIQANAPIENAPTEPDPPEDSMAIEGRARDVLATIDELLRTSE